MLRVLHLTFALLCAAAMSQFPAFHQQYVQRLGGAIDEVTLQLNALDTRAEAQSMERYDYIRHFRNNDDPVVQAEGHAMLDLVARLAWLETAQARLAQVDWTNMLVETLFHLEPDVAAGTANDFEPAIPLTISGGMHTFFGFIIGLFLPLLLGLFLPKSRRAKTA